MQTIKLIIEHDGDRSVGINGIHEEIEISFKYGGWDIEVKELGEVIAEYLSDFNCRVYTPEEWEKEQIAIAIEENIYIPCPTCNYKGYVTTTINNDWMPIKCPECNGRGGKKI